MSATTYVGLHLPRESESIPSSWTWHRLEDVCIGVYDCHHSTPALTSDGPIIVRSQDILGGVLDLSAIGHVSEGTYAIRISRAEPAEGDILYSREGTYFGIAAEVPPNMKLCLGQRMVLIRPKPNKLSSGYLCYWLNSSIMSRHLHGYRDGSVAERLNMSTIRGLPIPLPPLTEQRAIAGILGVLDDKIALNRQMNATLEAMARALFQSWFVDFDPVRAKAEGRTPDGMDAETAALFPGSFEDSALGAVPEGWRVSTIGEEVRVVGGSTPSTKEPAYWEDGEYAWATPKDLSDLSTPALLSTSRQITELGLGQISSGLLPVGTVLLSSRAPVGYLAIAEIPVAINQGFIAMMCDKRLSNYYVLWWATLNMDAIKAKANGTTFQEVSKGSFRPIPVLVPSDDAVQVFDDIVGPLYQQVVRNERESRTLAELRDALLPKLVSGELRVGESA